MEKMDGFCWKSCDAARPPGFRFDLCRRRNEPHRQISDRVKNEAPLSKTGPRQSSDARCPCERARVLSKVYVAVLICIPLSEESAAMKGFDIERTRAEEAESSHRSSKYGGRNNGGHGESGLLKPLI